MPRREESLIERLEQAEREGLLVPEAPPDDRADTLSYVIGRQWITSSPGTNARLVNIRPSSNSFRRALQHEMDGMRASYEDYERDVLHSWAVAGMLTEPLIFNPIPPDLARLVCSALDEALVYVEPIDDDEPWDDDDYVETVEPPARSPRPRTGMEATLTGNHYTLQFVDELVGDDEDDF